MKKKNVLMICTLLLLATILPSLAVRWTQSSANADEVIYDVSIEIKPDGRVDPSRATNESDPDFCVKPNGNIYTVRKNIRFRDTASAFILAKDNVTLDLNGHDIYSRPTGQTPGGPVTGVFAENLKEVTIKNGNITDFQNGIYLRNVKRARVFNNTLSLNTIGIYARSSSEVLVEGNVLLENVDEGIYIWQSINITVVGNDLLNWLITGILVQESRNIEVLNNIVSYDGVAEIAPKGYAIEIRNASDNTVKSNTLVNNTGVAGIAVTDKSYGNVIEQNMVTGHTGESAIYIENSNETDVKYNKAMSNVGNGIEMYRSCKNKIRSNIVSNNTVGINLNDNSNNNYLFANTLALNTRAGIALHLSTNNSVDGNTVSNNLYGILLQGCGDTKIRENHILNSNGAGISLQEHSGNTKRNEIIGNFVFNSSLGISISNSGNNWVKRNDIMHSLGTGLQLYDSSGNEVAGNYIQNSDGSGISLLNSDRNKIRCNAVANIFANTSIGINVTNSKTNEIYYNNFIENAQQVCGNTLTENTWDDSKLYACPVCMIKTGGVRAAGNYWSDYGGSDDGSHTQGHNCPSDGIGDTVTPHRGVDYYPLMAPWTPIEGDVKLDGMVDIFDVVLLAMNFGKTHHFTPPE